MNNVREHLIRYPQARTSTVRYLVQREEMTKRLLKELEAEKRPPVQYKNWFNRMMAWWR